MTVAPKASATVRAAPPSPEPTSSTSVPAPTSRSWPARASRPSPDVELVDAGEGRRAGRRRIDPGRTQRGGDRLGQRVGVGVVARDVLAHGVLPDGSTSPNLRACEGTWRSPDERVRAPPVTSPAMKVDALVNAQPLRASRRSPGRRGRRLRRAHHHRGRAHRLPERRRRRSSPNSTWPPASPSPSPQPDDHRLQRLELADVSGGRFLARARHPGARPHRAPLRRRVRPARAPVAGVRGGAAGHLPAFAGEERLRFEGEHWSMDLLPREWSPGPITVCAPPIDIAAVNPWMLRMAAEVADGVHIHPPQHADLPRAHGRAEPRRRRRQAGVRRTSSPSTSLPSPWWATPREERAPAARRPASRSRSTARRRTTPTCSSSSTGRAPHRDSRRRSRPRTSGDPGDPRRRGARPPHGGVDVGRPGRRARRPLRGHRLAGRPLLRRPHLDEGPHCVRPDGRGRATSTAAPSRRPGATDQRAVSRPGSPGRRTRRASRRCRWAGARRARRPPPRASTRWMAAAEVVGREHVAQQQGAGGLRLTPSPGPQSSQATPHSSVALSGRSSAGRARSCSGLLVGRHLLVGGSPRPGWSPGSRSGRATSSGPRPRPSWARRRTWPGWSAPCPSSTSRLWPSGSGPRSRFTAATT